MFGQRRDSRCSCSPQDMKYARLMCQDWSVVSNKLQTLNRPINIASETAMETAAADNWRIEITWIAMNNKKIENDSFVGSFLYTNTEVQSVQLAAAVIGSIQMLHYITLRS